MRRHCDRERVSCGKTVSRERLEIGKEGLYFALQSPSAVIDYRILGPFEVVDHEPLSLGGRKQQAVLATLLLHRGEVVTSDRLIEAVWGGRGPATAAKTLQVYVSNLRKVLGERPLVTQGHGYVLVAEADQVDADRFAKLAATGHDALERGDPAQARKWLGAALSLWRGPALADFTYESFAQAEIARLEEARLAALEDRIEAELRLGQHAALVPELEALVTEHPLRERLYEQLMVALYRSGRQVDALDRYQRVRRRLIDEFGIEPGPRLQDLQRAVLSHDATLEPHAGAPRPRPPTRRRRPAWGFGAGAVLVLLILGIVLATSSGGHTKTSAGARPRPVGTVQISSPPSGGVYARGEVIATAFTCTKASSAPAVKSCTDSDGTTTVGEGSGHLDTSTVGAHTYTVVMTLKGGRRKATSITYAVVPLRVTIDTVDATAARSRTSVTLVCLGGGQGATCSGTVWLSRRGVTLAAARYSVSAGGMRSIVLTMTHAGSRELRHARGHHVRVLVTATLAFAQPAVRTITLRHRR